MHKITILLVLFFALIGFSPVALAKEQKQITIVNPIRGEDFWNYSYPILETPKKQYELITSKNIEATWLVRFDALKNTEVQNFLRSLNPKQEVGLFLEVTPALTTDAGVTYNQSPNWHYSKSVLVIGYSPQDRIKLIDTAMARFKDVLGTYPKSVGAWWIDAYSLQYMKDKYQIEVNMDVADQFSTDGYQVWGQYWSSPFYPSKRNALMPASSEDQKIGIVTIQWAIRDPFNGYGNGVFESTYSVQANDYMLHDLEIDYFKRLVTPYPQVVVGLENDFDWGKYGEEYSRQIEYVSSLQPAASVVTMEHFGKNYRSTYPDLSTNLTISTVDPLGSDGRVVWYQNQRYRVGWFYNQEGVVIRDLRLFNDGVEEACFSKACDSLLLGFSANQAIDEVNYGTKWVIDEGTISDFNLEEKPEGLIIKYKNGAGVNRTITFLANDIKVDDTVKTISSAILEAVESSQNASQIINQDEKEFISRVEWSKVLPGLLIDAIKFAGFVFLFLVLPGFVLSRRLLLAVPVGVAVFTLLAFILSWLKVDWLLWLLPVISLAAGFYLKTIPQKPQIERIDLLAWLLIITGSVTWILTQIKNGLLFNYGYGYWGPNGHDGIWHLQLINALTKNVPPDNFIFAGQKLENYHYFFDLLLAKAVNLLAIDAQNLLFRFFPFLIALSLGAVIYRLTILLANNLSFSPLKAKIAAMMALFLVYFGGSFGWIVSFFRDRSFGGETTFWAQQSISTLLNPPFAISLLLLFAGVFIYYSADFSQRKAVLQKGLLLILLWGTLIEFKAYAGVLILAALGLVSLYNLVQRRLWFLIMSIPVAMLSMLVFLPNNSGSGNLIVFSPLWLVRTMVEFEDRLGWMRLLMTMQSGVWLKEWGAYLVGIIIFVLGNLGWRFVSFFNYRIYQKFGLLSLMSLFGLVLPLLFLQKGTNWNIVQFFYYSLMIQAVFAGLVLAHFSNRLPKIFAGLLVIALVLLTIPTTLNTLSQYLPKRPPAKLSTLEIEALIQLKSLPEGIVLSPIYEEKLNKQFAAPKPLFAYTSTAYVSAFSGKPSFVADSINLEILDIDEKARINTTREILRGTNNSHKLLRDNNIAYLYLPKLTGIRIDEGKVGVEKIFENDEVGIYKVKE